MASVLQDILDEDLKENKRKIWITQNIDLVIDTASTRREKLQKLKTNGTAKSLLEFYDLVRLAINDNESRRQVPDNNQVYFTEEEPDVKWETEAISFNLVRREPGAYSQGAPFEGKIRNLRPILRESSLDPDYPDYRALILGYYYDNLVRFTCWAQTNKAANSRAEWFEDLMEEYSWYYKISGVQRVIFYGRNEDLVVDVSGNRWYGRPINYFVRTEKLRQISEKKIEEIFVNLDVHIE